MIAHYAKRTASGLWQHMWHTKLGRLAVLSLAVDALAYPSVYFLVSGGVLGTWWANTLVSKGLAPLALLLNTLALTGQLWPTKAQAFRWVAWWLPSAAAGVVFLTIVVTHTDLHNIQARAVVGLALFPFDYLVKRFVVFASHWPILSFFRKQAPVIWLTQAWARMANTV